MEARVPKVFTGWSRSGGEASLSDVHRSVPVKGQSSVWRRAAAFVGPAIWWRWATWIPAIRRRRCLAAPSSVTLCSWWRWSRTFSQ